MSLTEPKDIIYRAYYRVWNTTANRDVRIYIYIILWHLEYYYLNKMRFFWGGWESKNQIRELVLMFSKTKIASPIENNRFRHY